MVSTWYRRLLGRLLHLANSSPPFRKTEFYALKDRLLRRWGTRGGYDVQHIVHWCYACEGRPTRGRNRCWKCGGTGIFREFWVVLERWELAGYPFHRPVSRLSYRPDLADQPTTGKIEGRIEHRHYPYYLSREASYWLALVYDRPLFWATFGHNGYPCWKWTPLVILASGVFQVRCLKLLPKTLRWRLRCWLRSTHPHADLEGVGDWLLVPYWWACYWICAGSAWIWHYSAHLVHRRPPAAWDSRYTLPTAVQCSRCLWAGRSRQCVHTYEDDGNGDVVAIEECPRCGWQDVGPRQGPRKFDVNELPF